MARDNPQALAELGAQAVITGTWPMMHVKPDSGPMIRVGKPEADDPTADGEDWEITLTDCTLSGQLTIRGRGKVFFDGARAYLVSL